jgi:hypothetical protein
MNAYSTPQPAKTDGAPVRPSDLPSESDLLTGLLTLCETEADTPKVRQEALALWRAGLRTIGDLQTCPLTAQELARASGLTVQRVREIRDWFDPGRWVVTEG